MGVVRQRGRSNREPPCFCHVCLFRDRRLCAWQGDRRIVVTGMGIVSCLGNTLEEVSDSLHAAKPGIKFSEKYKEIGMKPC